MSLKGHVFDKVTTINRSKIKGRLFKPKEMALICNDSTGLFGYNLPVTTHVLFRESENPALAFKKCHVNAESAAWKVIDRPGWFANKLCLFSTGSNGINPRLSITLDRQIS